MFKKILIVVFAALLIGVGTGVYLWNEPRRSVEDTKNGIVITAANLAKEYNADEKKANAAYLDKVLEVTGTINEVAKNQDGVLVVTLDSGDPMAGVQCTMKDTTGKVEKGKEVTLKGFCKGNNMGVILTECAIK